MEDLNVFSGRSISVVNDLSLDEQIYLYEKTRELKDEIQNGNGGDRFKINDPDLSIYLLFFENSTRTKESFRNAAKFHNSRVNDFNVAGSSFNKKESITDTIRMLFGYSRRSMFIVRSGLEGVCRSLESSIGNYAEKIGMPHPSFINAGDGRHEHPTQEFLDEFSFLEQKNWNRDSFHIALVGDLFHGRTVHSKADGLKIFKDVRVDLVAPEELAMPPYYEEKMKANGFCVKKYSSIDEYLAQKDVARTWYFTRLQLERMGDKVREKAGELRKMVAFSENYLPELKTKTKFFHPLPRHKIYPTVPSFLDSTDLNGWDLQSMNGYFTRIMEIGLLSGHIGGDFKGRSVATPEFPDDFVKEADIKVKVKHDYKVGIKPVDNGIVIDHIGKGKDIERVWDHINKIRRLMKLNSISSHGVYSSEGSKSYKGIISLPKIQSFDERQIKMLGAIAPGCTLNIIKERKIFKKYRLHIPPRIYNFDEISCKNENCISYPDHYQNVEPEFTRLESSTFVCKYCEKPHNFHEIWDK